MERECRRRGSDLLRKLDGYRVCQANEEGSVCVATGRRVASLGWVSMKR
jgi:hypothetical protein